MKLAFTLRNPDSITDMKNTFLQLMEKGDRKELVIFLQSLTNQQKEELVPVIEERDRYYAEHYWESKEIKKRNTLLKIPIFICYPYKKIKSKRIWELPSLEQLEIILS